MMHAEVDGVPVILLEDKPLAFNHSVEGLDDPTTLKGDTSTSFGIAHTKEAARVLGGAGMNERNARRPLLTIGDGSDTIKRGNVILASVDRERFECFTIGGNASWFEYAKNTELKDVDLATSGQLSYSLITNTWVNPTLLYFPLVDFGSLEDRPDDYAVPITAMRPAFRISQLLARMMEPIGYRFAPQGRLIRHWNNFIVMQPTEDVRSQTINGGGIAVELDVVNDQYELTQFGTQPNPMYAFTLIGGDNWDGSNFWYEMSDDGLLTVHANMRLRNYTDSAYNDLQYRISVWDVTDGNELARIDTAPIQYTANGHVDVRLKFPPVFVLGGHNVIVGVQISGPVSDPLIEINQIPDEFTRVKFLPETEYTLSLPIIMNTALPDMTIMELITGLRLNQRLSFTTDTTNKVINVWYSDEYYQTGNKDRRDWRERQDTTTPPKKEYEAKPTKMQFRFKEDTGDRLLARCARVKRGAGYGNEDFDLGGWTAPKQVALPFAPTAMGKVMGGMHIPIMRDDGNERIDDSEDPNDGFFANKYNRQPRLLYAHGVTDHSWTLGASDPGYYPRCYFTEPRADSYPIAFGNTDAYGVEAATGTVVKNWRRTLRRMKYCAVYRTHMLLHDHELKDFHHGVPTLALSPTGEFTGYAVEIIQHLPGRRESTQVRMVEMDSNVVIDFIPTGTITYPGTVAPPFLDGYYWHSVHGLLYAHGGQTYMIILHAIELEPGDEDYGTIEWSDTHGLVLSKSGDDYALIMDPSPVFPDTPAEGTFSWSDTYHLLYTHGVTTYQVDIIQL